MAANSGRSVCSAQIACGGILQDRQHPLPPPDHRKAGPGWKRRNLSRPGHKSPALREDIESGFAMGEIRKNIAALQAREGSECILYSQGLIIHGYLKDVLTVSWGIRCSFDPIPTAGLLQPNMRTGVSVDWNDFGESDRDWSSSAEGATWFVFLEKI